MTETTPSSSAVPETWSLVGALAAPSAGAGGTTAKTQVMGTPNIRATTDRLHATDSIARKNPAPNFSAPMLPVSPVAVDSDRVTGTQRVIVRRVSGQLFVVATPLGNLDDLSVRALHTLRRAGCIVCEDTRRTARLLARAGIERPLISCHRFNEGRRLDALVDRLRGGQEVALVSDGGTPGVSDPGALLVAAAWDAGVVVSPIPGPSAVATLLSASGLPADRYVFEGFLPHRAGERRRRLRELRPETRTLVLFESPQRIRASLADMLEVLGVRTVVLGRELTKLHESILRGSIGDVAGRLSDPVRGEITLVVAGADAALPIGARDSALCDLRARWSAQLAVCAGDRRRALRELARELGLPRAETYRRLAELGADDGT